MSTLREAAEVALKSMEHVINYSSPDGLATVVSTLREALAQPEQKPVAWMDREGDLYKMPEIDGWAPPHTMLYTLPPQRTPLTDEDIEQCMKQAYATVQGRQLEHAFARAIERAHGIGGEK